MRLVWDAQSHQGHVRARNEDAVLAAPPLFAVADGMGGHQAGDVASAMVVGTLSTLAEQRTVMRTQVLDAIRAVDAEIHQRAAQDNASMGTTLSALVVMDTAGTEPHILVVNVGDSRCYRLRNGVLVQLTHDHSVVQELIDDGTITPEDAAHHPERNVITRSLGSGEHLEIDWWLTDPRSGDRFLVCSDGLTRELNVTAIAELLSSTTSAHEATDALLAASLAAGGRDNVSVVVLDVLSTDEAPEPGGEPSDPVEADTNPRHDGVRADTAPPEVSRPIPERSP